MVSVAKGEIQVGLDLGGHEYEIVPDWIARYTAGVDDDNPWYTGDSPFGGPVAPALILHSEVYRFGGWYLPNIYGNLHAKQDWELFQPTMVGDSVTTRSLIIDRYVKRDREYVVNEVTCFGSDGRILNRGRTCQSFLREPGTGVVVDKEREKRSERRFDVGSEEAVEELPGLTKDVTLEMCQKFSGPAKNYHNDLEAAKALGFPDIVVQGMMPLCFLSQMMTERFGAGWFAGGRMSVNLVNVLWQKEQVTCGGLVTAVTPEGQRRRAHVRVWCEKPGGTKVVMGSASAIQE